MMEFSSAVVCRSRTFLKDIGQLTPAVEQQLNKYYQLESLLKVLNDDVFITAKRKFIQTLKKLRDDVIYGPYVLLKNKTAALSVSVHHIAENQWEIPPSLKRKASQIKNYFESITKEIDQADNFLSQFQEKIEELKRKGYVLTKKESITIRLMLRDLTSHLEIAEADHKKAETAIKEFENLATQYIEEERSQTRFVCIAAGAFVGAGVGAGVALGLKACTTAAAALVGAGTGGGLAALLNSLYLYIGKSKLDSICEDMEATLKSLKDESDRRFERKNAAKDKGRDMENPDES